MERDDVMYLKSSHETRALSHGASVNADSNSDVEVKSLVPPVAEDPVLRRRIEFQLDASFDDDNRGSEGRSSTGNRLMSTCVSPSPLQVAPRRDFSIARLLDSAAAQPSPSSSRTSVAVPMDLRCSGSGGLQQLLARPSINCVVTEPRPPTDERREGGPNAAAAGLLRRGTSSSQHHLRRLQLSLGCVALDDATCHCAAADELQRQMNDGRPRRRTHAQHHQYDSIRFGAILIFTYVRVI